MKRQVFRVFLYLVFYTTFTGYCVAQTPVTIYTPHGSVVPDTYLFSELTQSQIASQNLYVSQTYPNATKLADASATYNCHAYAWYTSEGGSNVWIGATTSTAEDVFWTDGSYVENTNQIYPAKVSYASDNHSATTTSQTDVFISKWGSLPLMQHNKNYCPYNSSSLKYYIKAPSTISGPSKICDQGTYTINNFPAGATVVWSGSSNLALSSASANSAVFTANSNGAGWIQATVNGIALAQFSVWVGGPTVEYIDGPTTVQPGIYNLYYAQPQNTANSSTTYYWHVYPSNTTYTSTGNSIELAFPSGQSTLVVSSENACGYGMDEPELDITATGSGYLTLSPNPSADLVQVSLDATSTNSTLSTNTYSVKVVDDYGTIVSSGIKKEKKFNIPISTFRNGIYTVIVSDGTNTYQNKLIVKH